MITSDDDVLDELLAAPAMRLVRELVIAPPGRAMLIDLVVHKVADAPCGRSVRSLELKTDRPVPATCLAALRLERLAVHPKFASTLEYEPALAGVRELVIAPRDRSVLAKLLCEGAFPELRGLELTCLDRTLAWTADDLAPLLAGTAAPKLERLAIHTPRNQRELARVLRRMIEESPLRTRLAQITFD
jgi:hypothetical protein